MRDPKNAKLAALFDAEFKNDKDVHKFALIWASKAHTHINGLLRNRDVIKNISENPGIAYFAKNFIDYFYAHGVRGKDIGVRSLYRGVDTRTFNEISRKRGQNVFTIKDTGFVATSKERDIAEEFADRGGVVMKFRVKDLPNVPYVVIDENVSDFLMEEEVVFLPGAFEVTVKHDKAYAEYKCNVELVDMLRAIKIQSGGGGDKRLEIPDVSLHGKYAVYYRHVYDRSVEILGVVKLPKRQRDVLEFYKKELRPLEREYERMTGMIPEYQDLAWGDKDVVDRKTKRASYYVLMAVYNPKTREIEHYNYGHFDWLLEEAGVDFKRRDEVSKAVKDYMRVWCASG